MVSRLPAEQFLQKARTVPVVDVRSPAEFGRGHIPGANSIPLFDDLERAEVGTLYHKAGRDEAIGQGMRIAGPRMNSYVDQARKLATEGELLVYCWRGGMRSESMAWFFQAAGIQASVLENGYKGFRRYIRTSFDRDQKMIVVGGMTGSGKTCMLNKVSKLGLQHIDLEDLAHHKGSVFGNLGLPEQPTNEHFENQLGKAWLELDPGRSVFIEDESINIGRVSIPMPIYKKIQQAPLFLIDMPLESRVERLFREYASFPSEDLKQLIHKISRRLGGANTEEALKAIEEKRLKDAIRISLRYYDKTYSYDLKNKKVNRIYRYAVPDGDVERLIPEILKVSEMI